MWIYSEPIIWNDGTTVVPPDQPIVEDFDCPFNEDDVEPSEQGRIINLGISVGVALLTCIMTVFVWKKWKNHKIEPLNSKHEMSTNDFMVMMTVLIELLQYAAMGPEFRSMNAVLVEISAASSINLDEIMALSSGVYWIFLQCALILCTLWLMFGISLIKNLDIKYDHIKLCATCGYYAENILPLIGNVFFLPIVSILLDVYVCDESSDGTFENTFMYRDCHEYCW